MYKKLQLGGPENSGRSSTILVSAQVRYSCHGPPLSTAGPPINVTHI